MENLTLPERIILHFLKSAIEDMDGMFEITPAEILDQMMDEMELSAEDAVQVNAENILTAAEG